MNLVWPITGLYAGPLALWGYFAYGRLAATNGEASDGERRAAAKPGSTPFPVMVGKGAAHCGAGCMLGDIVAEWLCFGAPAVALWFGWQSIFADKMFAVWIVDYIFASSSASPSSISPSRPCADCRSGRAFGGDQGRHAVAHRLADRHVRLPWRAGAVRLFSPAHRQDAGCKHTGILVHHAVRHAVRLRHHRIL